MLQSLKKLIGMAKGDEAKSTDLSDALVQARAELEDSERQLATAGQSYADGLLHLDDAQLKDLMDDRQKAQIRRERASVLVGLIESRLIETREAEIVAALTAERDAAESEAVAVATLIRTEYPKLAGGIVTLLKRLDAADKTASAVNAKLAEAGRRGDFVQDVQSRVLPSNPDLNIWGITRLTEIPNFAPGWNSPFETGGMIIQPTYPPEPISRMPSPVRNDRPFGGQVSLSPNPNA